MTGDRRVFVLERTRVDVSNAFVHGQPVYLYDGEIKPQLWTGAFVRDAMRRLSEHQFDCSRDFFLTTGSQVPVLLLVIAMSLEFDNVNLLLFDATSSDYVHHTVT